MILYQYVLWSKPSLLSSWVILSQPLTFVYTVPHGFIYSPILIETKTLGKFQTLIPFHLCMTSIWNLGGWFLKFVAKQSTSQYKVKTIKINFLSILFLFVYWNKTIHSYTWNTIWGVSKWKRYWMEPTLWGPCSVSKSLFYFVLFKYLKFTPCSLKHSSLAL